MIAKGSPLTVSEVAVAIRRYLSSHGWSLEGDSSSGEYSRVHLLALRGRRRLLVEPEGETITAETRQDMESNGQQVRLQVARAVFTAMSVIERQEIEAALALPLTPLHREYVKSIQSSLEALGIGVFWVDHDRRVIPDQAGRKIAKKSRGQGSPA